jgi:hypothetical protein
MALMQVILIFSVSLILQQGQLSASQHNPPPHIIRGSDTQTCSCACPPDEDRERARNEISTNVQSFLASLANPVACDGIGWIRIAYLNMTDPDQMCPSPWTLFTSGNKRVCFRNSSSAVAGCDSVFYDSPQQEYSQVCGRIIGYQYENPHGFFPYHEFRYSIDTFYIDGISVTHGSSPRQHIWTFAAGWSEVDDHGSCPCGSPTQEAAIPPFIGNNYFCETGTIPGPNLSTFYPDDPLWDGEGCGPGHSCECELNSPPWFTANLTSPTTNDIEVRSCSYQSAARKNVGIELMELYVK